MAPSGMPDMIRPLKIATSHAVAFSQDGELLATLGRDVWVWDLALRKKIVRAHPFANPSYAAFSPDRQHLAVKSTSGRIVIADARSGDTVVDFDNAGDGEGSNLLYSSCGEFIVDGSWGGRLSVRRASSGVQEFVQDFQGEGIDAVHSCDGGRRWVVAHTPRATAGDRPPPPSYYSVWDWPFRAGAYTPLPGRVAFARASALSNDGSFLAVAHGAPPSALSVFRLADGACVAAAALQSGGTGSALGWSVDGRLLGSVQDGKIAFYNWPGLTKMRELELAYPCDIAFSPRADAVAVGSWQTGWVLAVGQIATADLSRHRRAT